MCENDFRIIKKSIRKAIQTLLFKDAYLFINNLNERSITHKLGEYLQEYFDLYNIDCEYNRMVDSNGNVALKAINIETLWDEMNKVSCYLKKDIHNETDYYNSDKEQKFPLEGEPIEDSEGIFSFFLHKYGINKKRILPIFPDIICHMRGTMNNNFVIEAKKSSNRDNAAKDFDIIKILAMVKQLNYKYGFYVIFPCYLEFAKLKNYKVSFKSMAEYESIYEVIIGK